ncbi:MAG: phage integrase SAM-like domain-containing protein, partial [Muribaculaceae bacterium]
MAKITPVIVKTKQLRNGKHKVRIAVAHNGETRYIATDIIIDSDKEFKNGAIVKRFDAAALNTKLRGLLQATQNSIDNTEYCEALSCTELVTLIKQGNKSKYLTLDSLFEELIDTSSASEATKFAYKAIWATVPDATRSIRVKNITYSTIIATEKHFKKLGNSQSTIHNKMQFLKQLVRFAVNCGYADFKVNPFANY